MSKKIRYTNEFELCYLRHQYLKKVKIEVEEKDLDPYKQTVEYLSINTYYLYRGIFEAIGMTLEDIFAISRVHLINFLGLFALEMDRKKMTKFLKIFKNIHKRKATQTDILFKNRNSFTAFLRQRMEDLVRICKQKIRNIKGARAENYMIFSCNKEPVHSDLEILENYRLLGYRKVNHYTYQGIKRKSRPTDKKFHFDGKWYIIIPIDNSPVTDVDLSNSGIGYYNNEHNMDPETLLFHRQETKAFEENKYAFNMKNSKEKLEIFQAFVENNKDNKALKEEIRRAQMKIKVLKKRLILDGER